MMTGRDADAVSRSYAEGSRDGKRDTLREVAPWLRHAGRLQRRHDPLMYCTCGLAAVLKRLEGKA